MNTNSPLSPGQEKKLNRWLAKTNLRTMINSNIMEGKWQTPIDQQKLWALYEFDETRRKEGWAATFDDMFGDFFQEMDGLPPQEKLTPEMRYYLGLRLFLSDCERAVTEIMLAAHQGYPPAMSKAAEIFCEGELLPRRDDLALNYAERAKDAGDDGGLALLAYLYATGRGRKKDEELAANTLKAAIESGNTRNYRYLGICHVFGHGLGGTPNVELAEEFLFKAFEKNDWAAAADHCDFFVQGIITNPKYKIDDTIVEAVRHGYPRALKVWALYLLELVHDYDEMDDQRREEFIQMAAEMLLTAAKAKYLPAINILREDIEYQRIDGSTYHLSDYQSKEELNDEPSGDETPPNEDDHVNEEGNSSDSQDEQGEFDESDFQQWVEGVDPHVQRAIKEFGWPSDCRTEENFRELYKREKMRRSQGWYLAADDVYEKFFSPETWAAKHPSQEERFTEAMLLLHTYPRVGTGKVMLLAQENYVPAMEVAADLFIIGEYLEQDLISAFQLAHKACELGSNNVFGMIAYIISYASKKPDITEARKYLMSALRTDHPLNLRYAAMCYMYGDPMGQNERLAHLMMHEAGLKEDGFARIQIYEWFRKGRLDFLRGALDDPESLLENEIASWPSAWIHRAMTCLHGVQQKNISQEMSQKLFLLAANLLFKAADRGHHEAEAIIQRDAPLTMPNGRIIHLSEYAKTTMQLLAERQGTPLPDKLDMGGEQCLEAEYDRWKVELEQNYEFLLESSSGSRIEQIKSIQELWVQYKDAALQAFPMSETELNKLNILSFLVDTTRTQALMLGELLAPVKD